MVERLRSAHEPKPHEPKLAALALLQAGLLSDRGRQRLLRHVARCEPCRNALEGLRRFETIAVEARQAEPPAIDWARIERAALSAARSGTRRRLAQRWLPALAAAALLAFGVQSWIARRRTEPIAQPRARPTAPALAPLAVQVTALIGVVHLRLPDGRSEPLTLDSHPQPGATLETEAGAEAHLWLADTAQVLVTSESHLQLNQLARDHVELAVQTGHAVSKVRPLGQRRYEVLGAGYRVAVRGTHFAVRVMRAAVDVRVDEGHVRVLDVMGAEVADLIAPNAWASETPEGLTGAAHQQVAAPPPAPLRTARHAPAAGDAMFSIPVLAPVVAWHIDGDRLSGLGELRMRVPPGLLELGAELADGRIVKLQIEISPLGTRFDPAWLRLPGPAASDRRPAGELDPAAASAVLRGAQPAMQRCYERSLRTTDLAGSLKLKLRLAIDAGGRVRSSELAAEGPPLPRDLAACVRDATRGLVFPAPGGGGITFEAPLSFRTR